MSKRKNMEKKSSGEKIGISKTETSSITTMTLKKVVKKTSKRSSEASRQPVKRRNNDDSSSDTMSVSGVSDVNPRPMMSREEFKLRTVRELAALRSGIHALAYNIQNVEYIMRHIQGKINELNQEVFPNNGQNEQPNSVENRNRPPRL